MKYSPENLVYTLEHEWIAVDGDTATVGITNFAQQNLGDVVYLDLPAVGKALQIKDVSGNIESIKAVSNIYSPLTGTITEINTDLANKPELVNSDPFGEGWIFRMKFSDKAELSKLISYSDYQKTIDQ